MRTLTLDEIEKFKTAKGGWTKDQLAEWGILWPPPKGWKKTLRFVPIAVVPAGQSGLTDGLERRQELIRTRTGCEMILDAALRDAGIDFKFQVPIGPYFADFRIAESRLLVEVDGSSHDKKKAYDRRRDTYMRGQRWKVVRVTNREVTQNAAWVIQKIRALM